MVRARACVNVCVSQPISRHVSWCWCGLASCRQQAFTVDSLTLRLFCWLPMCGCLKCCTLIFFYFVSPPLCLMHSGGSRQTCSAWLMADPGLICPPCCFNLLHSVDGWHNIYFRNDFFKPCDSCPSWVRSKWTPSLAYSCMAGPANQYPFPCK